MIGYALETLIDVTKAYMKGDRIIDKSEIPSLKLKVCKDCPQFNQGRCKLCGCFMDKKVKIAQSKCPNGYWDEKIGALIMTGTYKKEYDDINCCKG